MNGITEDAKTGDGRTRTILLGRLRIFPFVVEPDPRLLKDCFAAEEDDEFIGVAEVEGGGDVGVDEVVDVAVAGVVVAVDDQARYN